ncbi:type II toxin-antitoxin system PemK/MazF family toxin [Deinococcus carri]|uniref:type II toxin-antitoxin system PemK/MazF family toxin n=1 Tax=Deinococcus carri TaxID=1211323 RepID=UPI0031EFCE36
MQVCSAEVGSGVRAVVITPGAYNARSRYVLVALVAGKSHEHPFEVSVGTQNVVLADYVYPLRTEQVQVVGRVQAAVLQDVLAKLEALLFER